MSLYQADTRYKLLEEYRLIPNYVCPYFNIVVVWVVMPCSLVRNFPSKTCYLHMWDLLPKVGGSNVLRNICTVYQTTRCHIPEDSRLYQNLKCCMYYLLD